MCLLFSGHSIEGVPVRTASALFLKFLRLFMNSEKSPEPDSSTPRLHIELLYLYFGSHIIFKVESEEWGDYAEEPDIRVWGAFSLFVEKNSWNIIYAFAPPAWPRDTLKSYLNANFRSKIFKVGECRQVTVVPCRDGCQCKMNDSAISLILKVGDDRSVTSNPLFLRLDSVFTQKCWMQPKILEPRRILIKPTSHPNRKPGF